MATTDTKSLLLVAGYMREGEKVVQKISTSIIPLSLIEICCKFYIHSVDRFIQCNSRNGRLLSRRFLSLSVHHKVIDTKDVISFDDDIGENLDRIGMLKNVGPPYCYIPKISWSLPNPGIVSAQSQFDGIMGLYADETHFDYRPCLILFNPSAGAHGQFDRFLSTQPFPSCTRSTEYLFCGEKHGIISKESDGHLYQLKLSSISSNAFRFEEVANRTDFDYHSMGRLHYLNRSESIFAIESKKESMNLTKVQCRVLSLQSRKWITASDEKFIYLQPDECGICSDRSDDAVYFVDPRGQIVTHDVQQQKWLNLHKVSKGMIEDNVKGHSVRPSVWFDREHTSLLYSAWTQSRSLRVQCYDLREKGDWVAVNAEMRPYSRLQECNAIF